jgi:hypothetical protein
MRSPSSFLVTSVLTLSTLALWSSSAAAQSIIRNPGDHPKGVEIEPHLLLAPFGTPAGDLGFGLGARVTFPIVDNGFVSTINNSVGIGVGLDWTHYKGCNDINIGPYHYECPSLNHFAIPVVMQWNFYLTRAWSVFGEPGLSVNFFSNTCSVTGPYVTDSVCPNYNTIDPVIYVGARWHFGQYTALTMRLGGDFYVGYVSVGVSFL